MNKVILFFNKVTSVTLALCILFVSCFSFQRCSNEESIPGVIEDTQIPSVKSIVKLEVTDDIILSLKKSILGKKIDDDSKPSIKKRIESNFGELNWKDNKLVTYTNGISGIFVPIVIDGEITSFLVSISDGEDYKSIIIEATSDNYENNRLFTGTIHFYTVDCISISYFTYLDGQIINSTYNSDFTITGLKSGPEQDCNFECVYTCFNDLMTSDWIYGTACAIACVAWETGIGLFVCICCIGGPALYCLQGCCKIWEE